MSTEIEKKETLDISVYNSVYENNENRVSKCNDYFKKIVQETDTLLTEKDDVIMSKGLTLIEKHKNFEMDAKKLIKQMYDGRIPITQILNQRIKQFTALENNIELLKEKSEKKKTLIGTKMQEIDS